MQPLKPEEYNTYPISQYNNIQNIGWFSLISWYNINILRSPYMLHCSLSQSSFRSDQIFHFYRIFPCGKKKKDYQIYKCVSLPNMFHWKLRRETAIIPLRLLMRLCIICSFRLSVKKRVNVSVWISLGIDCLECWPGYCDTGLEHLFDSSSCSLHNGPLSLAHIPRHPPSCFWIRLQPH